MGTAGRTAPATKKISVELKIYNFTYILACFLPAPHNHQALSSPSYTYLHNPRWGAGADHRASGPGESGVGRGVLGSGLGGVQHRQGHELLRGRGEGAGG